MSPRTPGTGAPSPEASRSRAPSAAAARLVALALAALSFAGTPAPAGPTLALVHVARPGDTFATIAQRYYGDPLDALVLSVANPVAEPLVPGERILVPTAGYHRVAADETWRSLADRYYGTADRAFYLAEINHGSLDTPLEENQELLVPYPLAHRVDKNDTLESIAAVYYGESAQATATTGAASKSAPAGEADEDSPAVRILRRFNGLERERLKPGSIVLVPLPTLTLTDTARARLTQADGLLCSTGDLRARQLDVSAQIPKLREAVSNGQFVEAVALGNALLGHGGLTGNQVVSVERELGTALVALGRPGLAVAAFKAAIARQPDLELDTVRNSPKVLRAFRDARDELRRERQRPNAGSPAAPPDGGPAPPR
ncbi:MAG: LysM peptidoglycan-binding domain-containing protein [Myxococcales bacterium]|nr:LysM peptidoglycan-binding domain-containing protein [Myxococcales bacterium]